MVAFFLLLFFSFHSFVRGLCLYVRSVVLSRAHAHFCVVNSCCYRHKEKTSSRISFYIQRSTLVCARIHSDNYCWIHIESASANTARTLKLLSVVNEYYSVARYELRKKARWYKHTHRNNKRERVCRIFICVCVCKVYGYVYAKMCIHIVLQFIHYCSHLNAGSMFTMR